MSDAVGIAVAQFAPGPDSAANLVAMRSLAERAAERGARLVVFPEYSSFFAPELGPAYLQNAEPLDGAFVSGLELMARELGLFVVAGMVLAAESERFSNTVVAVDPNGALVATYGKLHLYDAFGGRESEWIVPGVVGEPQTFTADGFTVGLQTCYDIRFPEVSRQLVDAGADLIVVPAEWVRGPLKEHHWRTLVTARAIENTAFLAVADHVPPVGVGTSLIVDPMGVAIAEIGEQPDVAVAWIDPQRLREVRTVNPALALRRFTVAPR